MEATRQSLLEKLKVTDAHCAWEEFYALYWAVIVRYAQKIGLAEAEAQDVLQETMVALMSILPAFTYDPGRGKFRNFLLTIVHRKSLTAVRRRAARREFSFDVPAGEDGLAPADRLAAVPETPDAEPEARWRESLMEEALRRVSGDPTVQARTFAIFRAYVLENKDCADVARQFGIKPNAVYQIKNRLVARLEKEVRLLTDGLAAPA